MSNMNTIKEEGGEGLTNGGKPHVCFQIAVHNTPTDKEIHICNICNMAVDAVPSQVERCLKPMGIGKFKCMEPKPCPFHKVEDTQDIVQYQEDIKAGVDVHGDTQPTDEDIKSAIEVIKEADKKMEGKLKVLAISDSAIEEIKKIMSGDTQK